MFWVYFPQKLVNDVVLFQVRNPMTIKPHDTAFQLSDL